MLHPRIATNRSYASISFCLSLILHGGLASAQNLATNPGFESGNTSGWFAFGTPSISAETLQVHSGSFAAQVTNRTSSYMGIAQSLVTLWWEP